MISLHVETYRNNHNRLHFLTMILGESAVCYDYLLSLVFYFLYIFWSVIFHFLSRVSGSEFYGVMSHFFCLQILRLAACRNHLQNVMKKEIIKKLNQIFVFIVGNSSLTLLVA